MKQHTKLTQKPESVVEQHSQPQAAMEFGSSDELLRFDAAQTTLPPEIAERLKRAASNLAPPPRIGWLKRFFGGTK